MNVEEFKELDESIEALRRSRERAKGAVKELEQQLLDRFDCKDLAAAKQKLKRMRRRRDQLQAEIADELKKFEETCGDLL